MPRTPDRFPGAREEEALQLENRATDPTSPGEIRYVNDQFRFNEGGTVVGLSLSGHRLFDELTHDLDEDYYMELSYTGSRVSNITVWTDISKTTKIREYQFSYAGSRLSQLVEIQYNGVGSEVERLTHQLTYQGVRLVSETVTRS